MTPSVTEQSSVHYTCILGEPADNAETMRHAIDILHDKHGVGKNIQHLVVAGDAKTYEYMHNAKRMYGDDLDWLLPYLGEWHLLKNIQAPLMKLYNDAGLRNLLSAFAVSISGNDGCSVAFDEAHEMLINKEFKMAMTTTGMGSMSRLLHYLPYRARVLKNLKSEIQCTDKSKRSQESLPLSLFKSHEANVVQYFGKLTDAGLLFNEGPQPDRIHHIFTGEISSEVVSQDLQTFYDKGEEDLVAFIRCVVLNTSGTKPPKRSRRNLKTFTVKKKSIQKQSYEIKDQKLQILSLRRQVALSKASNQPVECLYQFVSLPRAICCPDGLPFKACHSKKGFLDVFFRDCEFITGPDACGKLDDFRHSEVGLLAFYRLIGSVYFRKHCSAFEAESPRELLLSLWLTEKSNLENHTTFLESIRNGHFHRISGESEWMPSTDALRLHWQRCCWVLTVWAQACSSNVTVPELTSHGWTVANDKVSVVWDTEVNLEKVNRNIQHLKEGCKCKKG
ncbi:hypothetical protein BSL78_10365 [Apostichopus japonicus]|uniref:Uncharacterized protein n=1 Tax=Stichopus japonicus TaxID=307972 RepID=A0A2G8KXN2_STIJA|nr:hypothetical protein BSL78_10365 [Apostichopus japonicus]